jgi:hypothetical protein
MVMLSTLINIYKGTRLYVHTELTVHIQVYLRLYDRQNNLNRSMYHG